MIVSEAVIDGFHHNEMLPHSVEVVQRAFAAENTDGEELQEYASAYQSSGSAGGMFSPL